MVKEVSVIKYECEKCQGRYDEKDVAECCERMYLPTIPVRVGDKIDVSGIYKDDNPMIVSEIIISGIRYKSMNEHFVRIIAICEKNPQRSHWLDIKDFECGVAVVMTRIGY